MPFSKGYIPWNKDKKCPQISEGQKGRIPWNKGKKGLQVAWNKGIKGSVKPNKTSFKKGMTSWIKGLHIYTGGGRKKGCVAWNKGTKGVMKAWNKGISHSEETKQKISKTRQGKYVGKNSSNWKGGISKHKYYRRLMHFRRRFIRGGTPLSIKIIQLVYEDNIKRFGTLTCYLCLKPISFGKDCIEHKIPLSRNGTNNYDNLEIACKSCNSKKHSKTEEEYRKELILCQLERQ